MRVDMAALLDDPRLMLFGTDGTLARFIPMTRESYARSIFFDRRLQPAEPNFIEVPLDEVLGQFEQRPFVPPRLRFIHHFAHSGSTLLARALDRPDNLVIREPVHLRKLGLQVGAAAGEALDDRQQALLRLSLAMLGKRFASDSAVLVKGNVPISLLAEAIALADPGQPAILLHFPLDDYCAAVLRTESHRQWVETIVEETGLGGDPVVGGIDGLGTAEKAAALWLSMTARFARLLAANPAMRSLDANVFFERPAETIAAASDLLGAGLDRADAEAVVAGDLFATYSKNPNRAYDNTVRLEQREEAKARLAGDLEQARAWVAANGKALHALDRPLL